MNIDKSQIITMLQSLGKHDEAGQAQEQLPDTVDTEQHAGLLDKFGISSSDIEGMLPGGLGGALGKLGL